MLANAIAEFRNRHPNVQIKKIALWGLGFQQVAKVLLETTDDSAVFDGRHGEYVANEFGPGITFEGWPSFYDRGEGEKYEILMPDGTITITDPDQDGDEAINWPVYELLKAVLSEATFDNISKAIPLTLAVEIGNTDFKSEWTYGSNPPASYDYEEQVRHILGEPEELDDGHWMFTEVIDGNIVPMMWAPSGEVQKRFAKAIAEIDWSDFQVHEVRY